VLAGESQQRDLSWLDWGTVRDVSPDGKLFLFEESGEGGGPGYSVYVRNLDGSPAIRLGEGGGQRFLPDGKAVLAIVHPATDPRVVIYPLGAGESRTLPTPGLTVEGVAPHPDGRSVILQAREPGRDRVSTGWISPGEKRALSRPKATDRSGQRPSLRTARW
jgi:Tol biopolymer transport system component